LGTAAPQPPPSFSSSLHHIENFIFKKNKSKLTDKVRENGFRESGFRENGGYLKSFENSSFTRPSGGVFEVNKLKTQKIKR